MKFSPLPFIFFPTPAPSLNLFSLLVWKLFQWDYLNQYIANTAVCPFFLEALLNLTLTVQTIQDFHFLALSSNLPAALWLWVLPKTPTSILLFHWQPGTCSHNFSPDLSEFQILISRCFPNIFTFLSPQTQYVQKYILSSSTYFLNFLRVSSLFHPCKFRTSMIWLLHLYLVLLIFLKILCAPFELIFLLVPTKTTIN